MPQQLLELVKKGELDRFEARCLEMLEAGALPLGAVAACFKQLEQAEQGERVATLAQMVLENLDREVDPQALLAMACAALNAAPHSADLRRATIELYSHAYGQTPGFTAIMESSGLTTGRAARAALRVLDFCLSLEVGDTLISRMDDRVVEVVELDRERGLFTLRRDHRATTIPAREVVREYERIAPDDFRVLRQLHPERLTDLIKQDPVALVIGLIHAHGEHIDADRLKHELVPRYIEPKEWSKWWSRTRTQLKRSPHIIIEGRAPVVLSYSDEGISLEDETWQVIAAQHDPVQWLSTADGYLRELKARKNKPDQALLQRFHNHIVDYIAKVRPHRPGEALACALVLERLGEQGLPINEQSKGLATEILREAAEPAELVRVLNDDELWQRALTELPRARPQDWADCVVALIPTAPASQLDDLVDRARQADRLMAVQQHIDDALAELLEYPELLYWLWKGPRNAEGLCLPPERELFVSILGTVSALGTILTPAPEVAKAFRNRMRAALSLRGYARVQHCLKQSSAAAAVTLRRQLERLEGLGDNARIRMLEMLRKAHPQLWATRIEERCPWDDPDVLWATSAGIERKIAERDELVNIKMHENAKRIGEAAALGDLSENSEYKFALEERDFLRGRLARINQDLALARPIEPHDVPSNHVGVGSRIALRHVSDGSQRVMTFLGSFETDVDNGIFNYHAPISQKLMGLRVGDRATLTLDGVDQEFEIVSIESGLPA